MLVSYESNWRLNNADLYANPYTTNTTAAKAGTQANQVNATNELDSITISSSNTSEGCTDGKDDGKIGLFSAVGNAIKGVGKTIANGVKGMFTDSEGNFSLGKTLLSVGAAAACIAFPAVGVVACAVGGTMGAIQVGKGIYNAATADTDAEAKQAWQEIGGGAFTVAASVTGAKASIKAVQSSAGNASALAQLDDTASATQKLSALGKDMVTSTKNSAKNVSAAAKQAASSVKSTLKDVKAKASDAIANGKATASEVKAMYNESAVGQAETALKAAKASGNADDIAAAEAALKTAKADAKALAKETLAELADDVKSSAKAKASEVASNVKSTLTKENAAKAWNNIKTKIKDIDVTEIANNLKGTAKNILNELQNGSSSYAQVVQKYGYENVAQVIEYVAGSTYANNAI